MIPLFFFWFADWFLLPPPAPAATSAGVTLSAGSCEQLLVTGPAAFVSFALAFVPFLAAVPKAVVLIDAVSVPLPVGLPSAVALSTAPCDPVLAADRAAAVPFALVYVALLAAAPVSVALAAAVCVLFPVDVPALGVLSSPAQVYLPVSIVDFGSL